MISGIRLLPWILVGQRGGGSVGRTTVCGRGRVIARGAATGGGGSVSGKASDREKGNGGSSNNGNGSPANNDLLKVPGIGLRNRKLLTDRGLCSIDHLREKYSHRDIGKKKEKMIRFLKEDVGILHNRYVTSITDYLDELECGDGKGEDMGRASSASSKITFCVEGNISVGKTSFLEKIASQCVELANLVEIVPEPIHQWQDIGKDHFNILDAFYTNPERFAYTFQNYVFVTRMMQERNSSHTPAPLRLLERSVFTDRMVFVRAVHEARWMTDMEICIYDSWFDPVVSALPGLVPDAFVYLRADPETCLSRLLKRARNEENSVTLEYLQGLHDKHDKWLRPSDFHRIQSSQSLNSIPLVATSPLVHPENPGQILPDSDIESQVVMLGSPGHNVHPEIQGVPALILDCNENIDLRDDKDMDKKAEFAKKLHKFYSFVKDIKSNKTKVAIPTARDHALLARLQMEEEYKMLGR